MSRSTAGSPSYLNIPNTAISARLGVDSAPAAPMAAHSAGLT